MNQDTQTHSNSVARKGKHITFSERQQIERWLREKKSISQIAKLLDRNRVTILIKKTAKIMREVMESPCRSGSSPKISGELPAWDEFDDYLVSVIEHER